MAKEITGLNPIYERLKIIKDLVYDKCGFEFQNFEQNPEGIDYDACSFKLDDKHIQYRVAKTTPTKIGQFVAIWKRDKNGLTVPFDISDNVDFIIITSKYDDNLGQLIFPKKVLAENGIITRDGKAGKRGIRVYPPWDIATNKQAENTQKWQVKYFLSINNDITDLNFARTLLGKAID